MQARMWMVRWLYELLFCVHISLLIVWREGGREASAFLITLQIPMLFLDRVIAYMLQRAPFFHVDSRGVLGLFYGSWFFMTAISFACLHILGWVPRLRIVLWFVIAVVTILALPYFEFAFERIDSGVADGVMYTNRSWRLVIPGWLQWLEAIAVVCALLFLSRKAQWGRALVLAVAHFALWGLMTFGQAWRDYWPLTAGLLVLPLCVLIDLGAYVRLGGEVTPAKTFQ